MEWLKLFGIIFIILILRYVLFAGGAYWYFWVRNKSKNTPRKIQDIPFSLTDIKREIKYSVITSAIFALVASLIRSEYLKPYVKMYSSVELYGWTWFFGSILFLIVFHDTYFYWMHRLVHKPKLFKRVHAVHHESKNPTPFAAFSFHPTEAVLEVIWLPILHFFIPFHEMSILIFSFFMLGMNVMGHLGLEIYPRSWVHHSVFKYLNFSANHNDHHKFFKGNYGLYFTIWDRLMGTYMPHTKYETDRVALSPLRNGYSNSSIGLEPSDLIIGHRHLDR